MITRTRKAFTLIELVIVGVIFGIIIFIGTTSWRNARAIARNAPTTTQAEATVVEPQGPKAKWMITLYHPNSTYPMKTYYATGEDWVTATQGGELRFTNMEFNNEIRTTMPYIIEELHD